MTRSWSHESRSQERQSELGSHSVFFLFPEVEFQLLGIGGHRILIILRFFGTKKIKLPKTSKNNGLPQVFWVRAAAKKILLDFQEKNTVPTATTKPRTKLCRQSGPSLPSGPPSALIESARRRMLCRRPQFLRVPELVRGLLRHQRVGHSFSREIGIRVYPTLNPPLP